jgi:hypothetical protein
MKINQAYLLSLFIISAPLGLYSQNTTVQLTTAADSVSSFQLLNSSGLTRLRLNADGGFYVGGTYNSGNIPVSGIGTRLMWYPRKAALRSGYVSSTQWNEASIGDYSVAIGFNTIASGSNSFAAGNGSNASGGNSMAFGLGATASGSGSTAFGAMTSATALYSTAMGEESQASGRALGRTTIASGENSLVTGRNNEASGNFSFAGGYDVEAMGAYSMAFGDQVTTEGSNSIALGKNVHAYGDYSVAVGCNSAASGNYSMAFGYHAHTGPHRGAMVFSDSSSDYLLASNDNEMRMRFSGGFVLHPGASGGVALLPGANSWSSLSDSTKKELFLHPDLEAFLNNLAKLRLGSWNYKNQDSKIYRHYGPMAQEIFHYFGKDKYGTIGNDTTLSGTDIDGLMMICLQALEKRTVELRNTLDELRSEKEKTTKMEATMGGLREEIEKIKEQLRVLTEATIVNGNDDLTLNSQRAK